jgi:integrase
MTLDEALGRYWLEHAHDLRSADNIELRGVVLRRGLGKDILLSEINPALLTTYAARRRVGEITHAPNSRRRGVRLANSSVNAELALLRTVLIRARDVWETNVPRIKWKDVLLQDTGVRQHILSRRDGLQHESGQDAEEERLFKALRLDFHSVVRFALITGARFSNVVCLTWDQVNWTERHIVFRVKSKMPDGEIIYVPITNAVAKIILVEQGRHPVWVFTFLCCKGSSKTNHRKGMRYPFTSGGFYHEWNRVRKEAGLWYFKKSPDNFRFHDLRHTAATRALRKSGNLKTVQKMLGHKEIATTARYARTDIEDVRAAMEEDGGDTIQTQGSGPVSKNTKRSIA